jgi:hypothetical protein
MVATIRNPIVHCQSNSRKGRSRVNVPWYNQFCINCLFVRIKKKQRKMTLFHIRESSFYNNKWYLLLLHIYTHHLIVKKVILMFNDKRKKEVWCKILVFFSLLLLLLFVRF